MNANLCDIEAGLISALAYSKDYRAKLADLSAADDDDVWFVLDAAPSPSVIALWQRLARKAVGTNPPAVMRRCARGLMARFIGQDDPGPAHWPVVRHAMADDPLANEETARDALARAFIASARELAQALEWDNEDTRDAPDGTDGRLAADERFAQHLAALGPTGKEAADEVRRSADMRSEAVLRQLDLFRGDCARLSTLPREERGSGGAALRSVLATIGGLWRNCWIDVPQSGPTWAPWTLTLTRVLWADVVKPRLQHAQRNQPAVVLPLLDKIIHVQTPGGYATNTSQGQVLLDHKGRLVLPIRRVEPLSIAVAQLPAIAALTDAGAKKLGGITAHRLLNWLITESHDRALAGLPDARVLRIEGGFAALGQCIGAGGKGRKELPAIVAAMAHLSFPFPDKSTGNLLSYRDQPARGQRKAVVELTVGTALLPGYTHSLPQRDKALVPITALAPLVGRHNDHGAQAVLQLRILLEFRKRAPELVRSGGALLRLEQWEVMATDVNLPLNLLKRVIARWTTDGDDGPAFLVLIGHDRYTLSDTHSAARSFLEEAGRRELDGAIAGKASAQRRRRSK